MKKLKRLVLFFLIGLSPFLFCLAAYSYWYFHRPLPEPIQEQKLFEGIRYSRSVEPAIPLVYHLIEIDLQAEGIGFFVTPRDNVEGFDYAARTSSQFLSEFGLQLAINGDFFDPWHDYHPLDYYPHVGDGVNARGLSINAGEIITEGYSDSAFTLYFTADNNPSFERPLAPVVAISGHLLILENGRINPIAGDNSYYIDRHPRTAIGFNEGRDKLIIMVVDGRQPSYSIGLNLEDLADLMLDAGAFSALNLDGGGSSSLVMQGADGEAELLNSPIHSRIPYRERPIANHLGIFARR
jgi:hypothetical protein